MKDNKMVKRLCYLMLKKRAKKYTMFHGIFLGCLIFFHLIKVFSELNSTEYVKQFFIKDNFFLLFGCYGVLLTLDLAGNLYQNRFVGIFPGNAKTRVRAGLLCDHILILEYVGMLAGAYLLLAAIYFIMSRFFSIDVPGVFSISYMVSGIFYLLCISLLFYSIFSLAAFFVRAFGHYVLIGIGAIIFLIVIDFFVSNGDLYGRLFTKLFYDKMLYSFAAALLGLIRPLVVFVAAGSAWAVSLAIQLFAAEGLCYWQEAERKQRWIYLVISYALAGQLALFVLFVSYDNSSYYEGSYDYLNQRTMNIKELFRSGDSTQMAGRRVNFPDKKQANELFQTDDYNSYLNHYLGTGILKDRKIISETEAADYGISIGEPLKENEVYIAYYFPNGVYHGDFFLSSLADSINHSLTYNSMLGELVITDPERITLIHNLFGDQMWKIAELDYMEDFARYRENVTYVAELIIMQNQK